MKEAFIKKLEQSIADHKKIEGSSMHDKDLLMLIREARITKEINLELIKEMNEGK